MSNISLIIEERPRNIGNFMVGRLLPFQGKRMVGPFIFIDHMGPVKMNDHQNVDIPPHPHIGLSTLTYLFEGNILHKDGLGTEVEIKPGQVNLMTAGKGIAHSERTPEYLRHSNKTMHGLQIWVALPKELEQMDPSFSHTEEQDLPRWTVDEVFYRLIAGNLFDKQSPVPIYSPLYFLEIKTSLQKQIILGPALYGEAGIYILKGSIKTEGNIYQPKELLIAKDSKVLEFEMAADTTVYIFGGEPFAEERHIYWNFVATNKEMIEAAKEKWHRGEFEPVPGETEFIPLPPEAPNVKLK